MANWARSYRLVDQTAIHDRDAEAGDRSRDDDPGVRAPLPRNGVVNPLTIAEMSSQPGDHPAAFKSIERPMAVDIHPGEKRARDDERESACGNQRRCDR